MKQRIWIASTAACAAIIGLAVPMMLTPQAAHAQGGAAGGTKCLRIGTDEYGNTAMFNDCPKPISIEMCYVNPVRKTYQMVNGRRVYDLSPCELDGRASFSIFPRRSQPLGKPAELTNGYIWAECYGAEEVFATLTEFNRQTLTGRGTCTSWNTEKVVSGAKPGSSYAMLGTPKPSGFSTPAQYQQRAAAPPVRLPSTQPAPPPKPRLMTSLATLAANGYPLAALRAEQQGRVGFSLTVNPSGMVVACRVTQPSGFPALDNGTCDLMMRRARFHPTGATGNLTYDGVINWRI